METKTKKTKEEIHELFDKANSLDEMQAIINEVAEYYPEKEIERAGIIEKENQQTIDGVIFDHDADSMLNAIGVKEEDRVLLQARINYMINFHSRKKSQGIEYVMKNATKLELAIVVTVLTNKLLELRIK